MTRYHLLLTVLAVAIVVMAMSLAPGTQLQSTGVRGAVDPGNGSHSGLSSEVSISQVPTTASGAVAGPGHIGADGGSLDSPVQLDDGGGVDSALQSGTASWYRDPRKTGLYAAVPGWHFGDAPYKIKVCRVGSGRCVVAVVSDACGCPGRRIVDLSPNAFQRLAALSVGLVAVTVAYTGDGPLPTPPPTDR